MILYVTLSYMDVRRISRFLTTGGLAAAVDYLSFLVLVFALPLASIFVPQTISFMMGFVVSFTLNRKWVFKSTGSSKRQLVSYSVLALINLVLSNAVMWTFVDVFGLNSIIAKFLVIVMVALWNYFIFSRLIFTNK